MKTSTSLGMLKFMPKKGCLGILISPVDWTYCDWINYYYSREYPADQVVSLISHVAEVLPADVSWYFSPQPHKYLRFSKMQQLQECFLTGNLVVPILLQKLLHSSQYSQISPAQAIVRSFSTKDLGQIHKLKQFPWEIRDNSPNTHALCGSRASFFHIIFMFLVSNCVLWATSLFCLSKWSIVDFDKT